MSEVTRDLISEHMKKALKARDKLRVSTLRLILASVKNAEIEKKAPLDDEDLIDVISKELKKRREAIPMYEQGGRPELAQKEGLEAKILEEYLPEKLGEEEIRGLVDQAVQESGASTAKDMGKVMAILMPKVKGRADGAMVSDAVREALKA